MATSPTLLALSPARMRDAASAGIDDFAARAIDMTVAAVLLVVLAPLLLVIAAAVYAADPGAVVFGHRRIGRGGRSFRCFKFRSMVVDAQARLAEILATDPAARAEWARDQKLRDDPRITPIGRFLRSTSLDELPQLLNVLNGTMSLVGPRPIVQDEAVRYGRYFATYCSVRPGITGLWQISGRNDVSYRRRVAMDVTYVRERSLLLYMKVLAWTGPCVLAASGSY